MARTHPTAAVLKPRDTQPTATSRPGLSTRHILTAWLVAGVTIAAFLPALMAGFVNWDDRETVVQNLIISQLSWSNLKWIFTHPLMGHYQPLALLTLAIDYRFWGLEAFGYHLTSVTLHALNAVLFYVLAVRLLDLTVARPASQPATDRGWAILFGAATAALLFAVHPLRVESVAWITERRDVLSACFYLAAALAYLKAHEAGVAEGRSRFWLLVSVGLILVSLLAKVIAATAPIVFLQLDWYPLKRLGGERGWRGRAARRVWMEKLLFILPAIVLGIAAINAQAESSAWRGAEFTGSLKPALGGLFGLSFYLWKTIWPASLSPYYQMPTVAADIDLRFVVSGAVVLAAGAALLIWRRRWPGVLVAWCCYLVLVLPVLGVFQNWPQIAADRYTYLPCMGWGLLLGAAVSRWFIASGGRARRWAGPVVAATVIAVLGTLTWQQTGVWSNAFTLWERVLAIEPNNYIGRLNYGEALLDADQAERAATQFNLATALRPGDAQARTNLGLALVQLQRYAEAAGSLRVALELDPKSAKAHAALGHLLYQDGDVAGGMEHLKAAVQFDPDDASVQASYGWHLRRNGQLGEAIEHLAKSVKMNPTNARNRHELAAALQDAKRYTEAANVLREGLEPCGRDPNLLDDLARLLATSPEPTCRDPEEAVRLAQEACAMNGDHPVASMLETLAIAYDATGRRTEAATTLESAIGVARQNGEEETLQRCRTRLDQIQKSAKNAS